MTQFSQTALNKVNRLAKRASYDADTIHKIIDESPICQVGFVIDGQPFVIPTIHVRVADSIYLHGAPASRMLKQAEGGNLLCLSFTLLDGLVMARSVFHSSMNYRSAVVFGQGRTVESDDEKLQALTAIVEHVMPGRTQDARNPNQKELDSTSVVAVAIASASAKVRTGGPIDDEEDYALPVWAGVVPLALTTQRLIADERLITGTAVPSYIQTYLKSHRGDSPS
jgi:hypothetical protein